MHLACFMGGKFAVIAANIFQVPPMEEEITRYHMETRAIKRNPVRPLPVSDKGFDPDKIMDYYNGDSSPLIESFYQVSRECIEDGADVWIAGCGLISPILTQAGISREDFLKDFEYQFLEFLQNI